jgi:hypothetical protein
MGGRGRRDQGRGFLFVILGRGVPGSDLICNAQRRVSARLPMRPLQMVWSCRVYEGVRVVGCLTGTGLLDGERGGWTRSGRTCRCRSDARCKDLPPHKAGVPSRLSGASPQRGCHLTRCLRGTRCVGCCEELGGSVKAGYPAATRPATPQPPQVHMNKLAFPPNLP